MTSDTLNDDIRHLHSLVDTAARDIKSGAQARLFVASLEAVVKEVAKLSGSRVKRISGRPMTSSGLLLTEIASAALMAESEQRTLTPDEKLARAHLRGIVALRDLLAAHGGTYSASEVAKLLGVTRQAVNKRTKANQLLAIHQGDNRVYPIWQFEGDAVVPGFGEALRALETGSQVARIRFFLSPHEALDGRAPIEALKAGRREDVLDLARRFGQHGAD